MKTATRGDAFARHEVNSSYVAPESRWVVSLIVGFAPKEAASGEDASRILADVVRSHVVRVSVHDRETGTTEEADV